MSRRIDKKGKDPNKSRVVTVRLTDEEYNGLSRIADESGKSVSEVIRCACSGKKLYSRLTPDEIEALVSLTDARGDLVNVQNALKGTSDEVKIKLFDNLKFMQRWVDAVNQIVAQWDNIVERLVQ